MIVGLIVVIGIVVALVAVYAFLYNNIITAKNKAEAAWSNIEANLQRRNDLIPNLVTTVKGYAAHEKGVFEAVTEARTASMKANTPEAVADAETKMQGALTQLFAVAENYPDLKANTNFLELQTELSDTENRIAYARQSYNDCVYMYNNTIETFPGNIVAGSRFQRAEGFEVNTEAAREVPKVEF